MLALCLLSQLAEVGHWMFVRHATCSEHGELIHAGAAGHAGTASRASAAHAATRVGMSARPATPSHEHDHCVCLNEQREPPRAHATLSPRPAALTPPIPQDIGRSGGSARHRLAPKTSPPA